MSATAIEPVSERASKTRAIIESKWGEIQKCLPAHVTPTRMLRVIQNAMGKNPKLLECTPISLMNAITVSSELGLEVNTPLGFAYIIPYSESVREGNQWKKVLNAQFQIGYRGLMDLAFRSGKVRAICAEAVHAKDEFRRSLGLHRDLVHNPAAGERGEVIGYYAVVELTDGTATFAYLTKEEAHQHGLRFSKAYKYDVDENKKSSPWSTNFDAMAKKTAIIQALKYAPKAIEDVALRRAIENDTEPESAINVNATVLQPGAMDGAEADPKKQNSQDARELMARFNDKIPGGITIADFERVIGGSIADAPVEEVAEGIMAVRDKCNMIVAMQTDFPMWAPQGRAMELSTEDLEALYADLKAGA